MRQTLLLKEFKKNKKTEDLFALKISSMVSIIQIEKIEKDDAFP